MRKLLLFILTVILVLTFTSCTVRKESNLSNDVPLFRMGPASSFEILSYDEEDIKNTLLNIDEYNIFVGNLSNADDGQIKELIELLIKYDVKTVVECGGTLNHEWGERCGETSAEIELTTFRRWVSMGGKIDCLFLDEPIGRVTTPLGAGWGSPDVEYLTYEQQGNELGDYIEAVRAELGDVEIYIGANFPHWGWKGIRAYLGGDSNPLNRGDYYTALSTALDCLEKRDIKVTGVQIDNPHEYSGHKGDISYSEVIRDVEDTVHNLGLKFNMIVNSEGGMKSPQHFARSSLLYLEEYLNGGAKPDVLTLESWYSYPDKAGPETEPYTMCNTMLRFMELAKSFYVL